MKRTEASRRGVRRRTAGALASASVLPTSLRAVLGYYADTGVFDASAIRVKRDVDDALDAMVADAYGAVEAAIADEFDRSPERVTFTYDTKLTMPAELTLGHVYKRAREATPRDYDPVADESGTRLPVLGRVGGDAGRHRERYAEAREEVLRAEAVTELVVEALLDGDMRDARNDDEYEDFAVNFSVSSDERRRIAALAQETLQARVEEKFARHPDAVRTAYDEAVERSEAHQERDPHFRELAERLRAGDDEAADLVRAEYRDAEFDDPPVVFADVDLDLPYLKTQYGRVGVIYDGMIEMYRAGGVPVDTDFERAIVLAIIGAQIWLDDIDDYEADVAEGQLTPVTAEYWLADSDADAYDRVVDITTQYLDVAKRHAAATDSTLTGIGIDYILRSGNPGVLPRS